MRLWHRSLVVGAVVTVGLLPIAGAADPPQAVIDLARTAIREIGRDPVIVAAVSAENAQGKTVDQIEILDEGWRQTEGLPDFMRGWIDSDCGRRLQEIKAAAPYYTLLWVTDHHGANVAMTDKVPAYWHGEEQCFKRAYKGGSGDVYIGEVTSDAIGRSVAQVCVPVIGQGAAIGVVYAVVDVNGL